MIEAIPRLSLFFFISSFFNLFFSFLSLILFFASIMFVFRLLAQIGLRRPPPLFFSCILLISHVPCAFASTTMNES